MARFTFYLLLIYVLASPVRAQGPGAISGVVIDAAGSAVAGASVRLRASDRTVETRTDERGAFVFNIEVSTSALLEVSSNEFEKTTVDIHPPFRSITLTL